MSRVDNIVLSFFNLRLIFLPGLFVCLLLLVLLMFKQKAIETFRDALLDLQHVNELETSSVISHREIMAALPPLRAAHAKEESVKAKKKADRKRGQSNDSTSGTPGKGGLFGWLSGSGGGKDMIGNG